MSYQKKMFAPALFCLLLCFSARGSAAPEPGQAPDDAAYLTIEEGALPLVLSVPHGGDVEFAGVPVRTGGTKVTDDHVNELAVAIQARLMAKTGKRAYLVGAKISRKYVDFNRAADAAYESPAVAPVYEHYYSALWQAVGKVRGRPGAMLIDIHGQSADKDAIFRGTKDGLTADNAPYYVVPNGLITGMIASGLNIQPTTVSGKENPGFNGGNIVRTFGVGQPGGLSSMQLEFGANMRRADTINHTAETVADALVAFLCANGAL